VAKNVNKMTPLLQVFDMKASVSFYQDMLGFNVIHTYEPDGHFYWASLELGGIELMLNAAFEDENRPKEMNPARVRGHGDTELYFEVMDVQVVYDGLKEKGLALEKPKDTHYNTRQLTLVDPDGYKLIFYQEVG
jgi:glyoxylase I family protein